ncbi:hypothetical protein SAMN05518855_1001777 [Paenibacillus sp. CF384]|nr:hypothetical protein SAMN05518855_1001777 [Paenibacillus sp. CF384]
MIIILIIIVIVAFGYIGIRNNQHSALRRMDSIQRSLDDINQKLRDMKSGR